jgi:hypothetical protein
MEAFDLLPPSIRTWLAGHDKNISAARLYDIYKQIGFNEAGLWIYIQGLSVLNMKP